MLLKEILDACRMQSQLHVHSCSHGNRRSANFLWVLDGRKFVVSRCSDVGASSAADSRSHWSNTLGSYRTPVIVKISTHDNKA